MPFHVEVYLKTEAGKDNVVKWLDKFQNAVKKPNAKITKSELDCLPDEVNCIKVDHDGDDDSALFYFIPALEPCEASAEFITDGDNTSTSSHNWIIPNLEFDGLWESLFLPSNVKDNLLRYATTCLMLGLKAVDPNIILCNRLIFLHGPPGTGKTTICKAIAQKLSIRLMETYPTAQLVEINCHSLLSKWFSESGKLVTKLFDTIRAYAADTKMLIMVLIDEVESLTSARQAAMNNNEPSDAIRVVNAVLTQLDSLRRFPNVFILATSNLSEAIDPAFKDRADLVQYIGLPTYENIRQIIWSCFKELEKSQMIKLGDIHEGQIGYLVENCEGLSGRAIRKLPILAFSQLYNKEPTIIQFLDAFFSAANQMKKSLLEK